MRIETTAIVLCIFLVVPLADKAGVFLNKLNWESTRLATLRGEQIEETGESDLLRERHGEGRSTHLQQIIYSFYFAPHENRDVKTIEISNQSNLTLAGIFAKTKENRELSRTSLDSFESESDLNKSWDDQLNSPKSGKNKRCHFLAS